MATAKKPIAKSATTRGGKAAAARGAEPSLDIFDLIGKSQNIEEAYQGVVPVVLRRDLRAGNR
jgi:hypothetical protein